MLVVNLGLWNRHWCISHGPGSDGQPRDSSMGRCETQDIVLGQTERSKLRNAKNSNDLKDEYHDLLHREQSLYPARVFSNDGRLDEKLEELLDHLKDLLPQTEEEIGNSQMSLFEEPQSADSSSKDLPDFYSTLSLPNPRLCTTHFGNLPRKDRRSSSGNLRVHLHLGPTIRSCPTTSLPTPTERQIE